MTISKIQITISSPDPEAEPFTLDVLGTVSLNVHHSKGGDTNSVCVHIDGITGNGDIATVDGLQKHLDLFSQLIVDCR